MAELTISSDPSAAAPGCTCFGVLLGLSGAAFVTGSFQLFMLARYAIA